MQNINNLIKKDWYFQGFNGVPAMLYGPARSMIQDMPNLLGFGYSACIEYFKNDVCYYLYCWEDLNKIHDELLRRFKADNNYLKFLVKTDEKLCQEVLNEFQDLGKIDWADASTNKLYAGWRKANDLYARLLSVSHIVEGFTLTTEEKIRTLINGFFPNNPETLILLTSPNAHSFMSTEHYELCLIARNVKKLKLGSSTIEKILANKTIKKKIDTHQRKYFWKLNGYTSAKTLDDIYFANEIKDLFNKKINFDKFIQDYKNISKRIDKKKKLLKKINSEELLDLLKISDEIFIIHDRRKEHMTQAIVYLELILEEIARRHKIPLTDLHYIRSSELEKLPKIWNELKQRRKSSIYFLFPKGEASVLTGQKAKTFFSKIEKNKKLDKIIEFKGNSACPGKVRGIVKVCRGESELSKMREGDILVACMTQPEFLPALKKAKAVVTDEGGLTCHTAIVARELGIPCIIGTKIATKVLKDGDLVEVDANKGIVRKI